jgi:hypothetical protein
MLKACRKIECMCARLEGLILRRRAAPSRRMRTGHCMRPHPSRRIAARFGSGRDLHSCRAAMLLSMRTGERCAFGQTNPTAILAKQSHHTPAVPRKRRSPAGDHGARLRPLARASAGTTIGWRGGPTCGCRRSAPDWLPCYGPVLYREPCNCNVSIRKAFARDPTYGLPLSRRTLVTSLPAPRMRAMASSIGSNATAMWKALA